MTLVAGKDITDVVVVTKNGYLNRFNINALPQSQRAKAGSSVVKLSKTDRINSIHIVNQNDSIRLTTENGMTDIKVSELEGSTRAHPTFYEAVTEALAKLIRN